MLPSLLLEALQRPPRFYDGDLKNEKARAAFHDAELAASKDRKQLQRLADFLTAFSSHGYDDVASFAKEVPACLRILACQNQGDVLKGGPGLHVYQIVWLIFGIKLPGKTLEGKNLRAFDPVFWRRALWLRVVQHQEYARLSSGVVGENRPYCSDELIRIRTKQLEKQKEWLSNSQLYTVIDGKEVVISLEKALKTAEMRMAKVYSFVSAIDRLAVENGLEMALITTTLPGDWHSNPRYKRKDWQWNGASPKDCADELTQLFQNVRRDLDNAGVYLSGLWAGELHKDGTPHRHYWAAYRPEHAKLVRAVFLKYFPGRLRLRRGSKYARGGADYAYLTSDDALHERFLRIRDHKQLKKQGFQVDVSVIDRERGRGASYCFKYLEKAMLQEAAFEANPSLRAIDASRSGWKMRSYDFFGIQKCLGRWDEMRRLDTKPADPFLFAQWVAARGGDKEGKIGYVADPETGAERPEQQGKAYDFLQLNGGLSALRSERVSKPKRGEVRDELALLKEGRENRYQEPTSVVKGVEHVQKTYACERVTADPETGEIALYRRGARKGTPRLRWGWVSTVVSSERTRLYEWTIEAAGNDAVRAAQKVELEAHHEACEFLRNFVGPVKPSAPPAPPVVRGQLELI